MKKVLTAIIFVALCLTMLFSLTACGEKEFQGNYKTATQEQLTELNTKLDTAKKDLDDVSAETKGYHLFGKAGVTVEGTSMQLDVDMSVVNDDKLAFAGSMKMTTACGDDVDAGTKKVLDALNMEAAYYYNDGKISTKGTIANSAVEIYNTPMIDSIAKSTLDTLNTLLDSLDLSSLLAETIDLAVDSKISLDHIQIATDDNGTKIKIKVDKALLEADKTESSTSVTNVSGSGEMILSFNSKFVLRGFKYNFKVAATVDGKESKVESNLTLVPYSGNISVPKAFDKSKIK